MPPWVGCELRPRVLAALRARVAPPSTCSEVAVPLLPRVRGIHHRGVLIGKLKMTSVE